MQQYPHKQSFGSQKSSYRPKSDKPETQKADPSMMSIAQMVSDQRGYGPDKGFDQYYYRKAEMRQRIGVNSYSSTKRSQKKLRMFYQNMGGVFNANMMSKMYGIYQDDNGEEKMVEFISKMPFRIEKGEEVYHNVLGEVGVLQESQRYGDEMVMLFQDGHRIRVKGDDHGWSVLQDSPVAASSAQGPSMFKEEVQGNPGEYSDFKKKVQKGIAVEMEHKETIEKIKKENPSPEKAAEMIAEDHVKEFPGKDYYEELDKVEKKLKGESADLSEYYRIYQELISFEDSFVETADGARDKVSPYSPDNMSWAFQKPVKPNAGLVKPAPTPAPLPQTPGGGRALMGQVGHKEFHAALGKVSSGFAPGTKIAIYPSGMEPKEGKMPNNFTPIHGTFRGGSYEQTGKPPFAVSKDIHEPKHYLNVYHGSKAQPFNFQVGKHKFSGFATAPGETPKERAQSFTPAVPEKHGEEALMAHWEGAHKEKIEQLKAAYEDLGVSRKASTQAKIDVLESHIGSYERFFKHVKEGMFKEPSSTLKSGRETGSLGAQVKDINENMKEMRIKSTIENLKTRHPDLKLTDMDVLKIKANAPREPSPGFKSTKQASDWFKGVQRPGEGKEQKVEREFTTGVRMSEPISPKMGEEHERALTDMNTLLKSNAELTSYYTNEAGEITHHMKSSLKDYPIHFMNEFEKHKKYPFATVAHGNFSGAAAKGATQDKEEYQKIVSSKSDAEKVKMKVRGQDMPGVRVPFKHVDKQGRLVRGAVMKEGDEDKKPSMFSTGRVIASRTDFPKGSTRTMLVGGHQLFGTDVHDIIKAGTSYKAGTQSAERAVEYHQEKQKLYPASSRAANKGVDNALKGNIKSEIDYDHPEKFPKYEDVMGLGGGMKQGTSGEKCPSCGSTQTEMESEVGRAADEAAVQIHRCKNCKGSFRL